jgi:hypothetical protein
MQSTKNNRRKLAELSLIYGVPIFTNADENSRLAGLQRKLQMVVLPDLSVMETLPEKDVHEIDNRIEQWLKKVGWWSNPTHVTEAISFCMDLIEESPFKYHPKIQETLILIAEHLERGKEFKPPAMDDRDALLESWKTVYE